MAHAGFSGLPPAEVENLYWLNIDKYHLSYLYAEESPQKIAEKERLENVIKDFLGHIPHNRKFFLSTTAQIFQKSVTEVSDFSIVKLSHAWTVIGQYAQNLISQPWRKEFHKIQMYSGYYEHNVRNILIGGEQMLMFMGYELIDVGVMYLEGPVDPDRVALVSKDCFIASTECQVMFQIYSEMIGRSNNITYEDILHFRERNVCDMDKAVIELSSPHHHMGVPFHPSMGIPYGTCAKVLHQRMAYNNKEAFYNPQYGVHYMPPNDHGSYSPVASHNLVPQPYVVIYPTNGCPYPSNVQHYSQQVSSAHPGSVPTGQLIEVDSAVPSLHNKHHSIDKSRKRNSSEPLKHERPIGHHHHHHYHQAYEDDVDYRHSRELVSNWLQHDQLEVERNELARKVCEELKHQASVNETPTSSSSSMLQDSFVKGTATTKKKEKKPALKVPVLSTLSSRPVSLRPSPSNHNNHGAGGTGGDSSSNHNKVNSSSSRTGKGSSRSASYNGSTDNFWECLSCTFHNKPNVDICEMCDKSRIQGNEAIPLASGGRECDFCTLVNERGEEKCRACGECLKDSPTYI